ncbi:MAG: 4-alpha-glucanotransferase [Rhodobacterales bacterium]|nr:MAG: 4-alpha-glucanotransferase [Rhodobacterales bacterium]
MDGDALNRLCWEAGITTHYGDREVPDATKHALLAALGVSEDMTPQEAGLPRYDSAPSGAVPLPGWLRKNRTWGLFCQLYELRSARSWGIGDFADLARAAEIAARAGADFLGINPLHALFLAAPERNSPFTPSNRRFLNPLYIAMDALPGNTRPDKQALARARAADLVDYPLVARLKHKGLRAVFSRKPFDADRYRQEDFEAFRAKGGLALERHALFEALSEAMAAAGHGAGWKGWPVAFHDPESAEVADFAEQNPRAVRFQLWLQWIAARQLEAAAEAARAAGMRVGLYLDLAVGEAPDGSATWSDNQNTLKGVVVGAPPDVFSQDGQNWALSALSPTALARADYAPFRALIAAQMKYAGALRIDHVMALRQLFLIPDNAPGSHGTHVAYPLAEMLRVVTEEAARHGAVVIGEDLGWVPDGFREVLHAANVLAYRILYFETDWGMFSRSSTYPEKALACISTHDLPTLERWWLGEDIALRLRFGLIDEARAKRDQARRAEERVALVNALIDGGQLPAGARDGNAPELPPRVLTAAYRFLAATPSLLVGVRLADLTGPKGQTNVPGTLAEHPNWRRRSAVMLDEIADQERFREVTEAMRAERPRAQP